MNVTPPRRLSAQASGSGMGGGPRAMQRMSSTASLRRTLGGTDLDAPRVVGEHYQLGAQIGRGGFGVVYSALDLRSARSVAIKQVSLADMDAGALLSIESEVTLLRKLAHAHIVTYFDTIRTPSHLHIVLEYMENGSLAQFMKKFGAFSEPLVAMYVAQVLRGLAYLHEQGVLHRDVKGANILTTKDGLVKLADFGVAVKLSETNSAKTNSVVGSPYWMAPEVIEMAGWSFAADIWSVGCTVIELLTTKPPYFDLAPMAALFRIVQDDRPPLPERISPALQDFMMKCFMKEPRLRSSAVELLAHPWIAQVTRAKVDPPPQLSPARQEEKQRATKHSESRAEDKEEDEENWDDEFGVESEPKPLALAGKARAAEEEQVKKTETRSSEASSAVFRLTNEDATALLSDDLWDDEEDEGQQKPRKSVQSPRAVKSRDEQNSWSGSALIPLEKRLSKLKAFREDDLAHEFQFLDVDEDKLVLAAATHRQLKHSTSADVAQAESALDRFKEDEQMDDAFFDDEDEDNAAKPLLIRRQPTQTASTVSDVLFDDDELDFEYSSLRDNHQKATARVVELLALLDPSMDDQVILDACTDLQELLESNSSLRRDLMSQPGVVPNIMEALEMKKLAVLCAVLEVVNVIVQDNKRFQENLALVGLIPVVIRLTRRHATLALSPDDRAAERVRLEAAKFVRQTCQTSALTLQMFVACGGLPVLVDFLTVDDARPVDEQKELLRIAMEGVFSVFRLQTIPKNDICRLFVKAGLLRQFIIVFHEIASRWTGPKPVEDAPDVGQAPAQSTLRRRPWSMDELDRMCDVLLVFSQGDVVVKEQMCDGAVVQGMLHALTSFAEARGRHHQQQHTQAESTVIVKLLKCLRNLSMEPVTLEDLTKAGTISTLVRLLQLDAADQRRREEENLVLQATFYLCRLNRARQTHAAEAGVVPALVQVVRSRSPLKQFALPLLCDFAHASAASRAQLWTNDGVALFLELLEDRYWQLDAIKSLSVWLVHDTAAMERALLAPEAGNLVRLIQFFGATQDAELEVLLEPLLEMVTRSVRLNQALGRSSLFVAGLLAKLRRVPQALVRKNLLKMLKSLFEHHAAPALFVVECELFPTVFALAQDANSMILVREIASQLLHAILQATGVC